jgi:hypothetical protein
MPAAITTLRSTIAAALANAGIWSVYKYPPRTITANAVIIDPGDPYISPSNNRAIGISPMARFTIILTKPLLDNEGNLNEIETMAVAVFTKLSDAALGLNIEAATRPSSLTAESGDLLTMSFNISTLTSWS